MKRIICFFVLLCFLSCTQKIGAISAKSAVLINGDTGEVLYSLNKDERLPMASTTKIMTALLLCKYGKLSKEITVTKKMVTVEGTAMGLRAGDKITLNDLLYGMMLCSGNDAANAVAITVGGSLTGFAKRMNAEAFRLGLKNTSFATPSGLDADNHYTSCYDLALITKEAFKYAEFSRAVSSEKATVWFGSPKKKYTLTNHNKLLKMYDDVVGVKTGFTKKSGRCLVSASKKDGKFVICVTLNDKDDWADHRKLLDIGLSSVKTASEKSFSKSIDTVGATAETVEVSSKSFTVCVGNSESIKTITYMPSFLYSPIKKNETVGYRVLFCGENEIKRINIKSKSTVNTEKITRLDVFIQNVYLIIRSLNEG